MTRRLSPFTFTSLSLGAAVAVVALGLASSGLGAAPADRPAVSVPAETITVGPSYDEYMTRQRQLHDALMREIPAGALATPAGRIQLTPEERQDLERPAPKGPGPLRIGLTKRLAPVIQVGGLDRQEISRRGRAVAGGTLQATEDGGFVWAASVVSEAAAGVRLRFTGVDLPPGADLYVLNVEGEAFGPYQRRGPDGSGDFWSHTVLSPEAIVVLRQRGPATPEDLRRLSFTIGEAGHIGPRFPRPEEHTHTSYCGNAICIKDATCFNEPIVSSVKNAVAKMEWISGAFIFTCTGGLLADTDNSTQIPYFLTANHCLNRNRDAQNMEAFWFYRSAQCENTCPSDSGFPRTLGATIKATGSAGDFTLLQLSQTPPSGTVMLGWNSAAIAFTNGADLHRISHPNFGAQVYSKHDVDTGAPTCTGWPRGERIYSRDTIGGTDGGSSGSPVVNTSSQVVGQLSGACGFNVGDVCDAVSNATVDGALAFYFGQVESFLDPGGGCTPSTEVCNDGLDNDCDGATDCADSNCTGDPACPSCAPVGASCTLNSDCCSNKCRGPAGGKTCR